MAGKILKITLPALLAILYITAAPDSPKFSPLFSQSKVLAEPVTPPILDEKEADRLSQQGTEQFQRGQYERAIDFYQQSLAITRELGDRQEEANILRKLGNTYSSLDQYQRAIDFYQQSLAINQELGDRSAEADSLDNLGFTYSSIGQSEKALQSFQQSLTITREIGDRSAEANVLNNLGFTYLDLKQNEKALQSFQQSLTITREIGIPLAEANTLDNLGFTYSSIGQYEKALQSFQQSLTITREIGIPFAEADSLDNLGFTYRSLGQYEKALQLFQQSLEINQELGDRRGESIALNNLGLTYRSLGQDEDALQSFQQSLAITREIGDRFAEADALNNLGFTYRSLGQDEDALQSFQQSLAISKEIGDRSAVADALNNLGLTYASLGQDEDALQAFQQSLEINQELGDRFAEANVLNNLGDAYQNLKQYQIAMNFYEESLKIAEVIDAQDLKEKAKSSLNDSRQKQRAKDIFKALVIIFLTILLIWSYPHLIVLLKKRNEFSKENKLILFNKIFEDLRQTNEASLANLLKTKEQRRLILNQFSQDYNFLNLVFKSDMAKIKVSEKERMNDFRDIFSQEIIALNQNNTEEFRDNADKLTRLFCNSLGFTTLDNSGTLGQLYGRMIDASNPSFQLNIRLEFPLIYACKTVFSEEDVCEINGLLNKFGIHADFFALLIAFDNYQEIRQQVRKSPYKNDFIVLNHDQLWDILAAKSPIKQLIKYILEQIDLVAVSPYTVGGPVSEKMFFGRAEEEKTLLQNIARNDYALLANRKTGKTSLLNKISPRLKAIPDFHVFNCDLQAVYDYESFFGELAISSPEFEKEINKLSEFSPLDFRRVVSNIKQRNSNLQIIFIFDEVDELLAYDIQNKEQLFKTFRSLSQRENIRFIFSGTTTLVRSVRDPDSPFFNFCDLIKLELLEEKAARELVTMPMSALGVKFENKAAIVRRILHLSALHPNIIQNICNALIKIINEKQERTITEQDLERVTTSQEFYEYFESLIWGQSTALEKLIVYTMWSYPEFTESEVMEEFKERGIAVEGVKASLETLLTYSTLSKKNDKYFFTFREFAKLMEERSDIQALTKQYQQELEGVES